MSDLNILSPETTTIGAITVTSGIILKIVETIWNNKSTINEHTVLRKELRDELDSVRVLLFRIQEEVDEWREKYYHQVETTNELLYEVSVLKNRLSKYESFTDEHTYLDD